MVHGLGRWQQAAQRRWDPNLRLCCRSSNALPLLELGHYRLTGKCPVGATRSHIGCPIRLRSTDQLSLSSLPYGPG